jgi:short-subunit dehydrogenase
MKSVRDRVVVVTGASTGVGRATALELAQRGATVVVTARRAGVLEDLAARCRELAPAALALPADVADPGAVEEVARRTAGRFGRIDGWVNNAAVITYGVVDEIPTAEWHRVVEVNLLGTYHGMRAALPWMREQGSGVVVNVASVLGKLASPYQSAYVATKHGIIGLSSAARQELRGSPGVRVATVLPGAIDTPLFQHAGNHTGRHVEPPLPVIDATRVAHAVVRCLARPRREVPVGVAIRAALLAQRVLPGALERVVAIAAEHAHFGDRTAPRSPGNLWHSPREQPAISGGWSRLGNRIDGRRTLLHDFERDR